MNLKSTFIKRATSATMALVLSFIALNVSAQSSGCVNERVFWLETFGQGTTITSYPDVINLGYQPTGDFGDEGIYRVANNVQQRPEWHYSPDHTGDANGKMLVVNGQAEKFLQKTITSPDPTGFAEGVYSVGMYIMNANKMGVCAPNPLLPAISVYAEYLDASNNWVALAGSPYTASPIPQSTNPTWVNISAYFNLPSANFNISQIRITLSDGTSGGCGNDFALDDLKFSLCPEGGPMPVTFTDVNAKQKGSGVSIEWSTSQEINSASFTVERSSNGNSGWQSVATVAGAGNSNLQHNYNAFDANPGAGVNYYRVRQVDIDGKYSFSKIVNVKVDNAGTRVSVIGNPFRNSFIVKFSGASQEVTARLLDITGKQVSRETWSVTNGETSKQFTNISGLQNGIYILTVQSKSGEMLFNGKILKQ